MTSARIGFSKWKDTDLNLATQLWGDAGVTQYICASGKFTDQDITDRLMTEIANEEKNHIQYWPIFELSSGELIGCCGIRPFKSEILSYEIGFHLREKYWGKGYASEAANKVIDYSFTTLKVRKLFAGHHPENQASQKLLAKLGFRFIEKSYYEPTGLYHPSYELVNAGS